MKQLKEKLENMDYDEVYELWSEHCYQELPELWQMIDEIVDLANHDDDVHDALLEIVN